MNDMQHGGVIRRRSMKVSNHMLLGLWSYALYSVPISLVNTYPHKRTFQQINAIVLNTD